MKKKILYAVIILLISWPMFTACNKSVDEQIVTPKTKQNMRIKLEDNYQFSDAEYMITIFSKAGYTIKKENELLERLNTLAKEENVNFIRFKLERFKPNAFNFVSFSAENKLSVSFVLEKEEGMDMYTVIGSECTCRGCDDGCSPKRHKNGDCYCTPCVYVGKCIKSETIGGNGSLN